MVFIVAAVGAAAWGVWSNPTLRERRYLALPPEQAVQAAKDSSDSALLLIVGRRFNEAGKFTEAAPLLKRAAENSPGEARIRDEWAKAQLAQGNLAEAFGQLREFAATHPDSADAHLLLGKFYLSAKASDKAFEEMQAAVKIDPNQAEAWSALSSLYSLDKNDQKSATDAARRAVTLRPDDAAAHIQLATLLDQRGDPEARSHIDAALPHVQQPEQRVLCARFLLKSGKPEDEKRAEEQLRQALKDAPEFPAARFLLGRLLTRRGNAAEALPLLKDAAAQEPNDPAVALELARLYQRLQRPADAKIWTTEVRRRQDYVTEQSRLVGVLSQNPKDRDALAKLAHLVGRHGDAEAAVRHHALLLGVPPDDAAALLAAAEDLKAGGYAEKAGILARQALEKTSDAALRDKATRLLSVPPSP